MHRETAFELAASNIRFGAGVTREVGMDLVDLGARRVLLVTDSTLSRMAPVQIACDSIESAGLACVVRSPDQTISIASPKLKNRYPSSSAVR